MGIYRTGRLGEDCDLSVTDTSALAPSTDSSALVARGRGELVDDSRFGAAGAPAREPAPAGLAAGFSAPPPAPLVQPVDHGTIGGPMAAPSAQYVAAAYRAASAQVVPSGTVEVQLPGLRARLSSGRAFDLWA